MLGPYGSLPRTKVAWESFTDSEDIYPKLQEESRGIDYYVRYCDRCKVAIPKFTHHYVEFDKFKTDSGHVEYILCSECFSLVKDLLRPYFSMGQ